MPRRASYTGALGSSRRFTATSQAASHNDKAAGGKRNELRSTRWRMSSDGSAHRESAPDGSADTSRRGVCRRRTRDHRTWSGTADLGRPAAAESVRNLVPRGGSSTRSSCVRIRHLQRAGLRQTVADVAGDPSCEMSALRPTDESRRTRRAERDIRGRKRLRSHSRYGCATKPR